MALPSSRADREYKKFVDDGNGNTAIRAVITGGTISGDLTVNGDLNIGDAFFQWDETDANANILKCCLPDGSATDSPTLAVGLASTIADTDLGNHHSKTEPGIALYNAAGDKHIDIRWDGVFFEFGSGGAAQQYQFSTTVNMGQLIFDNNSLVQFGSSLALSIKRNTVFGDDDVRFTCKTHPLVFAAAENVNSDFGKGTQVRSKIYITSETLFTVSQDEYLSLEHDTDNAVLSAGTGGIIKDTVEAGITASTTQTQGQGALTRNINQVSTVANANDTVTLPAAPSVGSLLVRIINDGANTLQIFPASGDDLGAGVDTATTLAAGSTITFVSYDATNWQQF